MTAQQLVAFKNPCAWNDFMQNIALVSFHHARRIKALVSVSKFKDVFDGAPVWHCAVSILTVNGGTLTLEGAGEKWNRRARQVAYELLGGVGQPAERRDCTRLVYRIFRKLSEAEIARLDPEWVAIVAEDPAREGKPW